MTDAEMWRLTIEIVVLAGIVGGGGYLYVRYITQKFDREFEDHHAPGE